MRCLQVYLGSQQSFNRTKLEPNDIEECKNLLERFGCQLFTHAPVVYNLAGKSSTNELAWNGNKAIDSGIEKIIQNLEYELEVTSKLNCGRGGGVVIHAGSFHSLEDGMNAIIKSIDKIRFPEGSMLLLENCAGEGNKINKNLQEIQYIISRSRNRENIGVVIDTAHTFGAGLYDLRDEKSVETLFIDFDKIIGLNKLRLIHLNDSRQSSSKGKDACFGSNKDLHECIGKGHIWSQSYNSLYKLCNKCTDLKIPLCLETEWEDYHNMLNILQYTDCVNIL